MEIVCATNHETFEIRKQKKKEEEGTRMVFKTTKTQNQ